MTFDASCWYMTTPQAPEMQALIAEEGRLRQEYREKERVLRDKARVEEDQLRQQLDEKLAHLERKRYQVIASYASPSAWQANSCHQLDAIGKTPEPVTSSSPVETTEPQHTAKRSVAPANDNCARSEALSASLADMPRRRLTASTVSELDANVSTGPEAPTLSGTQTQQLPGILTEQAASTTQSRDANAEPAVEHAVASPPSSPHSTLQPEEFVDVDVSHVVPLAAQRDPGATTYMICWPGKQATGKLKRKWPAHLWADCGHPAAQAKNISLLDPETSNRDAPRRPVKHRKLYTNDESLTDQDELAEIVNEEGMTPALWSHLLSADPSQLKLPISRQMKRDLWQGLQTLTRRKAEMAKADSDEDDGDQFGIQEGIVDDAADPIEPATDAASSDLDVLPPWGQDDSDYAESSSEERAQESQAAEQGLSDSDDEAGQPSLQDAYSMILEQAGLHGDSLQTALDSWMDFMTGKVSVMANSLVRGRIPGSHAAQLVIQKKLATAVIMVAGVLRELHSAWELKQLPKLQQRIHKIWLQSRERDQISIWQQDTGRLQQRVLTLVHEITATHSHKASPAFKSIRRSCGSVAETFNNLHQFLYKLEVAALPDAPARPARQQAEGVTRHTKPTSGSGESQNDPQEGSHDGYQDLDDGADSRASGSWLVDDEENQMPDHKDTLGDSRQVASELAWDAGRPPQCQTEVIVAPGTKAALLLQQQQQQEREQEQEQQHPESKVNFHSADQDSEVRSQTGASLQLSLDTADMGPQSTDVQMVVDQQTAAVSPHQPQEDAAAQVSAVADNGYVCNPDADDDADSYQGLPTSPPALTSPYQKQSGYGASDDEMHSVHSLQVSEGVPDQADAAENKQDALGQQQTARLVAEPQVMAGAQRNDLQSQQDKAVAAAEGADYPKPAEEPMEEVLKTSDIATDSPPADAAALHQPSLEDTLQQAEEVGLNEQRLADTDVEIDVEATPDASSAGALVEIHHTERSLWSWQSAKLCDTITPFSESVQLAYLTPSGPTCRDVNVQQLRPIPPSNFSGTHPLQRGDVVEVNLGHDKFMCAIVVSKHKVVPGLKQIVAKYKVVRSLEEVVAQRKVFTGFKQDEDRSVSNIAVATSGVDCPTDCHLYIPERRQVHKVSADMLSGHLRQPTQLKEDKEYVLVNHSAIVSLKEDCGYASTLASVGHLMKRRDAAAKQYCKEMLNDRADDVVQNAFLKGYLARQPTLKFNKTRKLLHMSKQAKKRNKLISLEGGAPAAGRPVGFTGGKRRRSRYNPVRRPPAEVEVICSQKEKQEQRQEQRQEQGRKHQAAEAQAQLQRQLRKQKQKEERRKSLTGTIAPLRVALASQADTEAMPLFPGDQKEAQVMIAGCMATKLKAHQWDGIRFLWKNVVLDFESQDEEEDAGGCILAHDMGLGKSLQVIALMHTYHAYYMGKRSVLVVPVNVVHNWIDEFNAWLPTQGSADASELTRDKVCDYKSPADVHRWSEMSGGVLFIGYQALSNLQKPRKANASANLDATVAKVAAAKAAFKLLCDKADIVVADEGHQIKNPKTACFIAMCSFNTMRRVALTGYPLQNNMDEYYTMIQWCKKDILDNSAYFHQTWAKPIADGQRMGASAEQIRHMNDQLSILQAITQNFVHRVGREQLIRDLPTKHEHVVLLRLSPAQEIIYKAYLEEVAHHGRDVLLDSTFLHTLCHRPAAALAHLQTFASGDAVHVDRDMQDSITEDAAASTASGLHGAQDTLHQLAPQDSMDEHSSCSGNNGEQLMKQGSPDTAAAEDDNTSAGADDGADGADRTASGALLAAAPAAAGASVGQKVAKAGCKKRFSSEAAKRLLALADKLVADGTPLNEVKTGKAWAVSHILKSCIRTKQKLVIFAQFIKDLDELEAMLQQDFEWKKGRQYLRLDGKSNPKVRQKQNQLFQDLSSSAQVYLVSTRAGSVGINLTAACRMIVYDELWNPVHNAQAIARIFRYSQKRETYVYRLIYKGTIEQRVYRRNVDKEGLFQRVVDKRTIKGTNNLDDVDLYIFEASKAADPGFLNRTAVNSSDEVLKSLLRADMQAESWIAGWENHIENLPEDPTQRMTAEERRMAAKRYAEEDSKASTGANHKRRRLIQKASMLDSDPDFMLSKAEAKKLEEARAAELQDPDPVPAPAPAPIPEAPQLPETQPGAAAGADTGAASGQRNTEGDHDIPDTAMDSASKDAAPVPSDVKEPAHSASPEPADDTETGANQADDAAANSPQLQHAVSGPAVGQPDADAAAENSATVGHPDADKAAKRSTTSPAGSSAAAADEEPQQAPLSSAPIAPPASSSSTAREASPSAGSSIPVKPTPAVMSEAEKISAAIKRITSPTELPKKRCKAVPDVAAANPRHAQTKPSAPASKASASGARLTDPGTAPGDPGTSLTAAQGLSNVAKAAALPAGAADTNKSKAAAGIARVWTSEDAIAASFALVRAEAAKKTTRLGSATVPLKAPKQDPVSPTRQQLQGGDVKQQGSPLLEMLERAKGCIAARSTSGHVQREPRSPSLPLRPAQTAAPVNLPESPGLKVPAALFVAQSPSDRNKAKEVWMAHHVRNCGKTIEQAEAAWKKARREALMLSPISKQPNPVAASTVAGPTHLHTATGAPAVALTDEKGSSKAPNAVGGQQQATPKQRQPDTDTQVAQLEGKAAGGAVADSPKAKRKADADTGCDQPKGLPPLKHTKAKPGRKADNTAQPAKQAAEHDKMDEANDAARKAAKRERKEARRAAKRNRAGSLEPAASGATADSSQCSAQAQQSQIKDTEIADADAQLPIKTRKSSAANVDQPHAKQGPHMRSNSQAVATSTNANTSDNHAVVTSDAPSAVKSPIGSIARQQFRAAQQKPSLTGHKRLRQSPGPATAAKQSPGPAVVSPGVPALFERHAASEALRAKGAQLESKLAAASANKLGQVHASKGATPATFYQNRKAAHAEAATHDEHKAASAGLHVNRPDANSARMQCTDAQTAPGTARPSSRTVHTIPAQPVQQHVTMQRSMGSGRRLSEQVPGNTASKSAVDAGLQNAKISLENSKQGQVQSLKDRHLPRLDSDMGSTQDDPHDAAAHEAASGDVESAVGRESRSPTTPAADLVDLSVDSDLDLPQQSGAVKQPASVPTIASRKRPRHDSGVARQSSGEVIDLSDV